MFVHKCIFLVSSLEKKNSSYDKTYFTNIKISKVVGCNTLEFIKKIKLFLWENQSIAV